MEGEVRESHGDREPTDHDGEEYFQLEANDPETRYFHLDVTVTCDSRDRGRVQAIQSPCLIVEVLSPTIEFTDRMWKLKNYYAHPTIEEYGLVDSQSLKIESYHKEQNKWIYEVFENTDDITLCTAWVFTFLLLTLIWM